MVSLVTGGRLVSLEIVAVAIAVVHVRPGILKQNLYSRHFLNNFLKLKRINLAPKIVKKKKKISALRKFTLLNGRVSSYIEKTVNIILYFYYIYYIRR